MKKFTSTIASLFFAVILMAQAPDIMNYQAVARNNAGQALANQTIRVRLSVVKNAVSQYSETRQVTTNALGLFNVQIGSAGALSTTGNVADINWQSNAAPGHVLKVELDINNSGLFTDMGSQALVSVPYALASKTATETMNIAGRPIDQTTAPTVGSRLKWNGTSWTPVKKDTIIIISRGIGETVAPVGASGPIVFVQSQSFVLPQVTVTGQETILATISASVGSTQVAGSTILFDYSICYQNINGGVVTPMTSSQMGSLSPNSDRATITAVGAAKLPAGTYRVFLGIRNPNGTISINSIIGISGMIEVRN